MDAYRWTSRLAMMALALGLARSAQAAPPDETPSPSPGTEAQGPASFNQCDKRSPTDRFRITLPEEAELKDLVGWITSVTCQKFVWDPAVRGGKITIVAPVPVTMKEAYGAFHSALRSMNLAVRDAGDFLEIVEAKGIQGQVVDVVGPDGTPAPSDRFVTQLVRPHAERLADVGAVLDHLKSEHGMVTTIGELVIITDTANNIRRAMKVVEQVDIADHDDDGLFVYPLAYAAPEDVAELLRGLLDADASTTTKAKPRATTKPASTGSAKPRARGDATPTDATLTKVVADVRTNSVFVVAPREDWPHIRRLIERVDVELPGAQGQVKVVRLSHADPEEIQTVLTAVIASRKETSSAPISVTADPATRALIIDAPYQEMLRLQQVIEDLDVVRRQVYMEVYLLEVSVDHDFTFGMGMHVGAVDGSGRFGVLSSAPTAGNNTLATGASLANGDSTAISGALSGLAAAVFGPSAFVEALGMDVPSFGLMIQAIQNDTDVNTIAEPHVTTADNKPAKIEVGETVPFRGAIQAAGAAANAPTYQNIQRTPVTLSVEITPHVNDDGEVALDIKLSNEAILPALDPELGPRTSTRNLELEDVVARDGQPLVLGGLIREEDSITENKIPGLGSIPVFGWLFKKRSRPRRKINLLMVLVPHVIDSPDDARRIHERRMTERREFLERETAFKRRDISLHVNYRKKYGLLSAVQREYDYMLDEDRQLHLAEKELERERPGELSAAPKSGGLVAVEF